MKNLKKKFGWKKFKGLTLIEVLASITIWSTLIFTSSSLLISSYKHKLEIDNLNEKTYELNDVEIDLKNRILSDDPIKYYIKKDKIIIFLKNNSSLKKLKAIEIEDGKLVENHYYKGISGYGKLENRKVVISKDINKLECITKGNVFYIKVNLKGEEKIICI